MKCIEVVGYGNQRKHLIPIGKIVDIEFLDSYTTLSLTNGKQVNIEEDYFMITEMLSFHSANLVTPGNIHTLNEDLHQSLADIRNDDNNFTI